MSGVQLPYMRHTLRMFGMLTGIGVIVLSLYIFITWSWGGVQGFVSRLWNLCALAPGIKRCLHLPDAVLSVPSSPSC